MKILKVNSAVIRQNNSSYNSQNKKFENKGKSYNISFFGTIDKLLTSSALKDLDHFKEFTIREYRTMPNAPLETLRRIYDEFSKKFVIPTFHNDVLTCHDYAASIMKTALDNTYGENNYVVFTIGRSLSSIGKVLGYRIGENNVTNVPMSDASRFNKALHLSTQKIKGDLNKFSQFIENKQDIFVPDKNYVLTDYCITENSLQGAVNLFKYIWGSKMNIFSLNFTEVISKSYEKSLGNQLKNFLYNETFKPYSFVEQCMELVDVENSFVNIKKAPANKKLVWFKLLDNEISNM